MTAAHVERLLALRDAEPLPLPWALLQLVAGPLARRATLGGCLPANATVFQAFADDESRTALWTDRSSVPETAAPIWRAASVIQRTAVAKALWAELQEEDRRGRVAIPAVS